MVCTRTQHKNTLADIRHVLCANIFYHTLPEFSIQPPSIDLLIILSIQNGIYLHLPESLADYIDG